MGRWINAAEALRGDPLVDLFDPPSADLATAEMPSDEEAPPPAPDEWEEWLRELFPSTVKYPFAAHHREFWEHLWAIERDSSPRPFVAIWAREGGKSTSIELGAVALGARSRRRYIGYVRRTQKMAEDSVTNIASKLESRSIELYYPALSRKLLSKYGVSRGWTRMRLRTAAGFSVEAFGLDTATRGAKLDDDRPDLWIFDDLDESTDTPQTTAQKISTITRAFLPAGAENCGVIAVQNLIIPDGIFSRLQDGRARFLANRKVSGPHKAVKDLKWEERRDPESNTLVPVITGGTPTWAGQPLEVCQRNMVAWGAPAFLLEAQHEVKQRQDGLALTFDEAEHVEDMTELEIRHLVSLGSAFGGIDFGSWRFGFTAWAANEHGVVFRWGEMFSQREELKVRARAIHDLCERAGIVRGDRLLQRFPMWGDAANPTDITEINARWKEMRSPLRVVAVAQGNKIRKTAVDRINDKFGESALRLVRIPMVAEGYESWLLGYNATNPGEPMTELRSVWEIEHWSYPKLPEGDVDLKQDPDDKTADGGDMIASMRYALMSWWRPGKQRDMSDLDAFAPQTLQEEVRQRMTLKGRKQRARQFTRGSYGDD